jgi:hypothetical protein
MAFLDQPPERFKLRTIRVHSYDGPPSVVVEQAEQRGVSENGRTRWRVALDSRMANRHATSVSVHWGRHPTRTIFLEHALLPGLDLSSLQVFLADDPPREKMLLALRYDVRRGWCGDVDPDDRPQVWITFLPDGVSASRQDMTNCRGDYEELDPGRLTRPP